MLLKCSTTVICVYSYLCVCCAQYLDRDNFWGPPFHQLPRPPPHDRRIRGPPPPPPDHHRIPPHPPDDDWGPPGPHHGKGPPHPPDHGPPHRHKPPHPPHDDWGPPPPPDHDRRPPPGPPHQHRPPPPHHEPPDYTSYYGYRPPYQDSTEESYYNYDRGSISNNDKYYEPAMLNMDGLNNFANTMYSVVDPAVISAIFNRFAEYNNSQGQGKPLPANSPSKNTQNTLRPPNKSQDLSNPLTANSPTKITQNTPRPPQYQFQVVPVTPES